MNLLRHNEMELHERMRLHFTMDLQVNVSFLPSDAAIRFGVGCTCALFGKVGSGEGIKQRERVFFLFCLDSSWVT